MSSQYLSEYWISDVDMITMMVFSFIQEQKAKIEKALLVKRSAEIESHKTSQIQFLIDQAQAQTQDKIKSLKLKID